MALNNLKYLLAVFVVVSCVKPKETTPIPKNVTYTGFSFFTSQNPNLPQDIYAEIKGDSIIASTFIGVNLTSLITFLG